MFEKNYLYLSTYTLDHMKNSEIFISVSDIERYGYCPLNWWLKFKGLAVSNEKLKNGIDAHKKIIKKVLKVQEHEKESKTSEFNILIFAFIAIIMAVNAYVILSPDAIVRNSLIYIAIIWIIIGFTYHIYNFFFAKSSKEKLSFQIQKNGISGKETANTSRANVKDQRSILSVNPQTWKRSAIWFLIIGGGLAFNSIAFLQTGSAEIMSDIFLVSALLWLIGTTAILYIVLRFEEAQRNNTPELLSENGKKPKRSMTESEKVIIGFAMVATLLAINGVTIQYKSVIANFTLIGQILIILAAFWLGASFAFLYLSFRSSIVARRFSKDIRMATTDSKKYKLMLEKNKRSYSIENILSYDWPMLFTVVVIILGVNSILILYGMKFIGDQADILSRLLIIISFLWLIGAFIFLYDVSKNTEIANELRRLHGIYKGSIEYTDKMDDRSKMLCSEKYKIRGKPDYVVKIKGKFIPIELKTGKIPQGPHFSHIIQIAAYCLLLNEKYHDRTPYGVISYSKKQKHKIIYDNDLKKLLLEKLTNMRKIIKDGNAHRNHKRPGKCRFCSRRDSCPERLA